MSGPDTLARYVAERREELGLSPNQLAQRTTTRSSADIKDIERGTLTAMRPRAAMALALALELDDWETDRFLYLAGCAPTLDWQAMAEAILDDLGLVDLLHDHARKAYAARRPIAPPPHKET